MNNDPIVNIHFVHVIENYRCLWDHMHEDYGKKDEIEKAWKDIVNIMHDSVSNCRKRWRTIQTNFLKIRRPTIGSGSLVIQKKNSYDYLQDHLHFLNIYVEEKKITDINNTEHHNAIDQKNCSPIQELLEEITVHNFTEFQTCGNTKRFVEEIDGDILQSHDTRKKKLKIDKDIIVISDSESEDCSPIKESLEESEKSKTNCESDVKFLKSLTKYIKLMSVSQKRKLKRKFIKVIDKILEENNSENDSTSIWNMTSTPSSSSTKEMDIYQKYIKNKANSMTKPPPASPLLSSELNNEEHYFEKHYWLCNLPE